MLKFNQMHSDQLAGSVIGALSSIFGMILNLIPVESAINAIVLAIIGATTGFFTQMLLRRLFKTKR